MCLYLAITAPNCFGRRNEFVSRIGVGGRRLIWTSLQGKEKVYRTGKRVSGRAFHPLPVRPCVSLTVVDLSLRLWLWSSCPKWAGLKRSWEVSKGKSRLWGVFNTQTLFSSLTVLKLKPRYDHNPQLCGVQNIHIMLWVKPLVSEPGCSCDGVRRGPVVPDPGGWWRLTREPGIIHCLCTVHTCLDWWFVINISWFPPRCKRLPASWSQLCIIYTRIAFCTVTWNHKTSC